LSKSATCQLQSRDPIASSHHTEIDPTRRRTAIVTALEQASAELGALTAAIVTGMHAVMMMAPRDLVETAPHSGEGPEGRSCVTGCDVIAHDVKRSPEQQAGDHGSTSTIRLPARDSTIA
jgi:hypothetical protein